MTEDPRLARRHLRYVPKPPWDYSAYRTRHTDDGPSPVQRAVPDDADDAAGLWAAYSATVLEVVRNGRWSPLTVDDVDGFAVVITADNPFSRRRGEKENRLARVAMDRELLAAGGRLTPARGRNEDGSWVENSRLVHGIDQRDAIAIGRRFGQNAIFVLKGRWRYVADCSDGTLRARRALTPGSAADEVARRIGGRVLDGHQPLPTFDELRALRDQGLTPEEISSRIARLSLVTIGATTISRITGPQRHHLKPNLRSTMPWDTAGRGYAGGWGSWYDALEALAYYRAAAEHPQGFDRMTTILRYLNRNQYVIAYDPSLHLLWAVSRRPGDGHEVPIRRRPVSVKELRLDGDEVVDFPY